MSYESRAYDKPNTGTGFGPDPVVVLVVEGTHDVSRLVNLFAGGPVLIEQLEVGERIRNQVRQHSGGRAALKLLAEHGGPNFTKPLLPGLTEDQQLAVLPLARRLAAGMTLQEIGADLYLSKSAIAMRISRARQAVGARTNDQLVAWFVQLGLVEPGPLHRGGTQ